MRTRVQSLRFHYKKQKINIQTRINNQITAPELRVIDEKGENLGLMPTSAALKLSLERGFDLIEIAPTAKPPVARIMSYDKFRYQKEKELKKQYAAQKIGELKQVKISMKEAINDMNVKARRANDFLEKDNKVDVTVVMRGREKMFKDLAYKKLDVFLKLITIEHKKTSDPKIGGRGLSVQITKK
ncbi:MAG: translation initiation factor IF-3 [Patescibacteria group bacterium]